MKLVIPHEHGGWAMVSVPFFLGMAVGRPSWLHIPLFLGWLFLYLSSYPMLQSFKRKTERKRLIRWGMGYLAMGMLFLAWPLWQVPKLWLMGPIIILLLAVNVWHAANKKERALTNDVTAVLLFSVGGLAAYTAGAGHWDKLALWIILFSVLQFMGSVFFVKSVFRERTNTRWQLYSKVYHLLPLLVPFLIGYSWMALVYLYSAIRAYLFAGKIIRPAYAGIIEMIGAAQFLILSILLLNAM